MKAEPRTPEFIALLVRNATMGLTGDQLVILVGQLFTYIPKRKRDKLLEELLMGHGKVQTRRRMKKVLTPIEGSQKYADFIVKFNKVREGRFQSKDEKALRQYLAAIEKGYTDDDLLKSLHSYMQDPYHIGNKFNFLTPEFLTRMSKLERGLNISKLEDPSNPVEEGNFFTQ